MLINPGEQLGSGPGTSGRRRTGLWPSQGAEQIGAADNTGNAPVANDRHPLDAMGGEEARYLVDLRFLAHCDDRRRHDVARRPLRSRAGLPETRH